MNCCSRGLVACVQKIARKLSILMIPAKNFPYTCVNISRSEIYKNIDICQYCHRFMTSFPLFVVVIFIYNFLWHF